MTKSRKSVQQHALEMLGKQAKDKVTGFKGMVASATFDAYGCVQMWITPVVDKEGKTSEGHWFDLKRIVELDERTLEAPQFGEIETGTEQGGNSLPARNV